MEGQKNRLNELNRFVIRYIIDLYEQRDIQHLSEIGISRELAQEIFEMSGEQSSRLARFSAPIANLRITESIHEIVAFVRKEQDRDQLINQMIELGASQAMLQSIIGLDHREFQLRREALGLPQAKPGRPPLLDDEALNAVHNAWQLYETVENIMERYLYIAMKVQGVLGEPIPLSQIWYHINTQN